MDPRTSCVSPANGKLKVLLKEINCLYRRMIHLYCRARAVYEANLPDNFRRPQSDSSLETFIRAKYEHKKYIAREWVPPVLPKVNWEKEIDEDIEKQKRKKKTVVEKKSFGAVDVPQLPKPTNPSPKPSRVVNHSAEEEKEKKESDLLGMYRYTLI